MKSWWNLRAITLQDVLSRCEWIELRSDVGNEKAGALAWAQSNPPTRRGRVYANPSLAGQLN